MPEFSNSDHLLEAFVSFAEVKGVKASFGLTITINGAVIGGDLIGQDVYYELLDSQLQEKMGAAIEGVGKQIADSFNEYSKIPNLTGIEGNQTHRFFHLKNARFISGGLQPATEGFLYRGKLSEVDGFAIGYLSEG